MSYSKEMLNYVSTGSKKNKKSYQFNEDSLIICNEDKISAEYVMQLKQGYEEMADINLRFCEMSCPYELEESIEYEAWLSESDMSDDDDDSEKRRYILC